MTEFSPEDSSSPPEANAPTPDPSASDRSPYSNEFVSDSTKTQEPFRATPIPSPKLARFSAAPGETVSTLAKLWLPVFLLVATCASTFLAGTTTWDQEVLLTALFGGDAAAGAGIALRQTILRNFGQGMTYMVCVVAILFAHEMGHYIAARIYKIPSSYPMFIPFPIAPTGTMGAVIGMQGQMANRREIFDIGIAGPLAGLVLAIPIICIGTATLDLSAPQVGSFRFDLPIIVRWMLAWFHPDASSIDSLYTGQVNAMFMAGWVGLLITGLNMLPLSQLDGGHVTYTLFGKHSRRIAQVFLGVAIGYMAYQELFGSGSIWWVMLLLVFAIGIYHPPTSDDSIPLGRGRVILGALSLLIPILCFPPRGLGF